MGSESEVLQDIRELVRLSWDVPTLQLTDDERDVWQMLKEEGVLTAEFVTEPTYSSAITKAILHPILRGTAKVVANRNPYQHDRRLFTVLKKLGRNKIQGAVNEIRAKVRDERWMTFVTQSERMSELMTGYLVPSFIMTTLRKALIIDFMDLLNTLKDLEPQDDRKLEKLFGVTNNALLVVKHIDARNSLYNRVAGALNWLYSERGSSLLSTVSIFGPYAGLSEILKNESDELLTRNALMSVAETIGIAREDPIMYKLFGPESHVCALMFDEDDELQYYRID